MASIQIDGRSYPVKLGDNLLKACLESGLDLPYFCWHPALGSVGACRQCAVVQYQNPDDARGKLVMACMTPVADGMRIGLQTPMATDFRAEIIEMLMTNHPHDCPVCEEGGECHLQDMTEMTGHTFRAYRGRKRTHRNQNLGPFINHEMNRCIACYRCVRYYQDYCGGHDLQVFGIHSHVYFGRQEDGALENEFSGNLVEVCPTGVFTDKTFSRHYTRKWDLQSAPSICPHCALGCNTSAGERYGTLRRVVNRYHGEINGYFLCDRGRFGYEFVNAPSRIRQSRIEDRPCFGSTEPAEQFARKMREAHGLVGIGSPRASLEANFALRELVGSENFVLGMSDTMHGMLRRIVELVQNAPVRLASIREAEDADAVLILGEDVSNTAPRLALALRQAARAGEFAVADRLRIPRWQDAAVRTAGDGRHNPLFVANFAPTRLDDIAAGIFRGGVDTITGLGASVAERVAAGATDEPVPTETQQAPSEPELAHTIAAALLRAERPLIVCGTGCHSEELIAIAGRIATELAARRDGRAAAVHFAVPDCNSLGLALLGGGRLRAAFDAIEQGRADTVVMVENDLYRHASRGAVDACFAKAAQRIVIDHIHHETAERGTLLLAAASYAESEGTWVSSEGRAQRYFQVFTPIDSIRPSWRWLAEASGRAWRHIDDLTAACSDAIPALRGIPAAAPAANFREAGQKIPRQTHRNSGRTAMLAQISVHEPKQPVDGDSALAFSMEGAPDHHPPAINPFVWAPGWTSGQSVNKFQAEIGGQLRGGDPGVRLIEPREGGGEGGNEDPSRRDMEIDPPDPADGRPFVPLYHVFGSEELSSLAPGIAERSPAAYLALSPKDAAVLGLNEGQAVPVVSADGSFHLPLRIMTGLAPGLAGIPAYLPGLPWIGFEGRAWEYRP